MNRALGRSQLESFVPQKGEDQVAKEEFLSFFERYPNSASRELEIGHFTASAWIVSPDRSQVLLTKHRKLGVWIPLGGHCDGDFDFASAALREAEEESGLTSVTLLRRDPIVLGKHRIPRVGETPEHFHYDLRFLCEGDNSAPLQMVEAESLDLKWIPMSEIARYTSEQPLIELAARTGSSGIV